MISKLRSKIDEHVGGKWVLVLSSKEIENDVVVQDLTEYLSELSEFAIRAFWNEYPRLTDREAIKRAVVINEDTFYNSRTIYAFGAEELSFGDECLHRIHRLLFKEEFKEIQ